MVHKRCRAELMISPYPIWFKATAKKNARNRICVQGGCHTSKFVSVKCGLRCSSEVWPGNDVKGKNIQYIKKKYAHDFLCVSLFLYTFSVNLLMTLFHPNSSVISLAWFNLNKYREIAAYTYLNALYTAVDITNCIILQRVALYTCPV